MVIDLTKRQSLDEILTALQQYEHPMSHRLDMLVVAYMVMDLQRSGKKSFTLDDATRYVFRIYTAPDSQERLAGDTRIGGSDGQNVLAYLSEIKKLVEAAKRAKKGLTDPAIEELIVTKTGYSLYEEGGADANSLALYIKGDAKVIFAYLLSRSQKSLPSLDRSRREMIQRSGLRDATAYALAL